MKFKFAKVTFKDRSTYMSMYKEEKASYEEFSEWLQRVSAGKTFRISRARRSISGQLIFFQKENKSAW